MALKTLEELNLEFLMEVNMPNLAALPEAEAAVTPATAIEAPNPAVAEEFELTEAEAEAAVTPATTIEAPVTAAPETPAPAKKRRGVLRILADVLFYTAILAVLFSAAISNHNDGTPKTILGYSYYTVLTTSMQSEIPKGAFILVRRTDPGDLRIGDDITFVRGRGVTVTHRIVGIVEDFEGNGARGFQTKGVSNVNPDKEIVRGEDVMGKVILVLPAMGAVISYLNENIFLVFIMYGLCIILSFCLRGLFVKGGVTYASNE